MYGIKSVVSDPKTFFLSLKNSGWFKTILQTAVLMGVALSSFALAQTQELHPREQVADRAEAAWMNGDSIRALAILDQGIQDDPSADFLQKLRGDILATSRHSQEAIEAYEAVIQRSPAAVDIRWAEWSVLLRSGKGDQAIAELQHIAQHDAKNPLIYLRVAQDLRKLDRLEESLEWYQKAVELVPDLPGWRLALARARFDVLDGRGARDEVKHVLEMVSPGSPEEMAARNLLSVVYGATKERGRRFQPIFSPEGTAAERKEWASIRAEAWRLFEGGHYKEAEPVLRRVLALKPSDSGATHDLGITLMELGRCGEAIDVLQHVLDLTASEVTYADTFFRIGICQAELGQWSEALVHFEILYDAAVEFEEANKDVPIQAGFKVLDKEKLRPWVEKARQHVPGRSLPKVKKVEETQDTIPYVDPSSPSALSEEEIYKKIASDPLNPEDPIYTRTSLMGRDADFSWFRFVISASHVMRDNLPGGSHEYIPIDPGDTFPISQQEIYLVFGLVTPSPDEVPLTAECFLETSKITGDQVPLTQDRVLISMNDQSGYFVLSTPEAGWSPGLYRCGLFVGQEVSAYTHADEIRFRIVEANRMS